MGGKEREREREREGGRERGREKERARERETHKNGHFCQEKKSTFVTKIGQFSNLGNFRNIDRELLSRSKGTIVTMHGALM